MPTGTNYVIGDLTPNGFTVLSERKGRLRDFGCPMCGTVITMQSANIGKMYSCGCVDRPPKDVIARDVWTPDQYPELIRLATAAFRSDYRYAEQMALDAQRVRKRREAKAPTL